jgi:hypothetical protein
MTTLRERLMESYRLCILRLLLTAGSYRLNDGILTSATRDMGHDEPRDVLRAELAWLERHQLVTVENPAPGLQVATLTGNGQEVAEGVITYPGVKRPSARG